MRGGERLVDRRDVLRGRWRPRDGEPAAHRPPGAVAASRFQMLCDGCAKCATACPADAIVMTGPATAGAASSPVIVAEEAPCVMCEGLVCAPACPTGALVPVTPETMRIAYVTLQADACWAHEGIDPDCDYCYDRCPLKGTAITYRRGEGPEIHAGECTGCGTCVYFCPASPKALEVRAITI